MAMNWMLISPMTCSAFASLLEYSPRSSLLIVSLIARCRIYGDTVSGVDTGTLDMLHDTRDQDIGSPSHTASTSISFPMQVFINEDRVILLQSRLMTTDKFIYILII